MWFFKSSLKMWLVLYVICHFHVEACLALGATAGNQGQNAKGLKIDVTFGVPPVSVIMWRVQNLMILKIQVAILFRDHYFATSK